MGSPEADKIRDAARERIAGRPVMVLDGEPIGELAKAHERHAERLDKIAKGLEFVGMENYLGETSEGRAATNNIRVAVYDDPHSVAETLKAQAVKARTIATSLRQIGAALKAQEAENAGGIGSFAR